jgi:nitrate reductase gamma subunit
MAAARRYAIANYDVTGISKFTYRHPGISTAFLTILFGLITLLAFIVDQWRPFNHDIEMLGRYYYETIHLVGMTAAFLLLIVVVVATYKMYQQLIRNEPLRQREYILQDLPPIKRLRILTLSLLRTAKDEFALQRRFKVENETSEPKEKETWWTSRWFVHMSISWGFIGLLAATGLDFIVKDMMLKQPGAWVPVYNPIRLLGIISGLFLVWGSSVALVERYRAQSGYYANSSYSDWLFLWLLWGAGVSGFLVTALVYVPEASLPSWAHWVLVAHVAISSELLLMLPFSKFAHVIYRSIALWLYEAEKDTIRALEELEKQRHAAEQTQTIKSEVKT